MRLHAMDVMTLRSGYLYKRRNVRCGVCSATATSECCGLTAKASRDACSYAMK